MSRATKRRRSAKASATGVDFDEPLPYKHVPQLWPFQYRHSSIEFVRLLSDANTSSHSHVFDVIIESKHYALKIVRCHLEFHSRKLSCRLTEGYNNVVQILRRGRARIPTEASSCSAGYDHCTLRSVLRGMPGLRSHRGQKAQRQSRSALLRLRRRFRSPRSRSLRDFWCVGVGPTIGAIQSASGRETVFPRHR